MTKPCVQAFFDEATNTVSYVVSDSRSGVAAIIDPVLDFDSKSGRTATNSANLIIDYVQQNALKTQWIIETHVHADHLSSAPYIQQKLGGQTAISAQVTTVQATFGKVFNWQHFPANGADFDVLFADNDSLPLGDLDVIVMATPGHTPACTTILIGDSAFVGDTLFMPDFGTARTDFPGGDARTLYNSIQRILSLPADTRLFMCHDYKAPGRDDYAWQTTVAEQRAGNVHINATVAEEAYVSMRTKRDKELGVPALMLPALQVNLRAGKLPDPESNDVRYLKIPLDTV